VIRHPKLRIAWETRVSEHGSKATTANAGHGADAPAGETRRDFIHIAAASVAAGGVAAVAWPFIQQLGPAADTRAASSAEVDVSKVPEGSEIRVLIGGMPFFIRHRTRGRDGQGGRRGRTNCQLRDPATDESRLVKAGWDLQQGDPRHLRPVHPPRLRAGRSGAGFDRGVRRLVLPMPRLALRYVGKDPERSRAEEPRGSRSTSTSRLP
jgi:hypothetical protein